MSLLHQRLPQDRYQFSPPAGGFFLWLRCPFETPQFAAWGLRQRGVHVRVGTVFSADGEGCRRYLRLSVSYLSRPQMQVAISRLCDALLAYEEQHADQ